jgi:hypothetical protein
VPPRCEESKEGEKKGWARFVFGCRGQQSAVASQPSRTSCPTTHSTALRARGGVANISYDTTSFKDSVPEQQQQQQQPKNYHGSKQQDNSHDDGDNKDKQKQKAPSVRKFVVSWIENRWEAIARNDDSVNDLSIGRSFYRIRNLLQQLYDLDITDRNNYEPSIRCTISYQYIPYGIALLETKLRKEGRWPSTAEDKRKEKRTGKRKTLKRRDLRIYTAATATYYYRGKKLAVSLEEVDELSQQGSDIVVAEKESVAKDLKDVAAPSGIGTLTSRGFLDESSQELAEFADERGGNTVIITDFDTAGLLLSLKVPNIVRIGVGFDTLDYFKFNKRQRAKLMEECDLDWNHYKSLEKHCPDGHPMHRHLPWLKNHRIEIDSIMEELIEQHGNEEGKAMFWQYVLDKLKEIHPTRDYTRSVTIYDYTEPAVLGRLTTLVGNRATRLVKPVKKRYEDELSEVDGFLGVSVDEKEDEIKEAEIEAIEDDPALSEVIEKAEELNKMLEELEEDDEDE